MHVDWYLEYEERDQSWCSSRVLYREWFAIGRYRNMKRISIGGTTLRYRLHIDGRLVFDGATHKVI